MNRRTGRRRADADGRNRPRIRRSTVALCTFFVLTLAVYLLVRPNPVAQAHRVAPPCPREHAARDVSARDAPGDRDAETPLRPAVAQRHEIVLAGPGRDPAGHVLAVRDHRADGDSQPYAGRHADRGQHAVNPVTPGRHHGQPAQGNRDRHDRDRA